MTTHIAFDCGDCVDLDPDQTVRDVMDDHDATCRDCPDRRTITEKRLDMEAQKNWEARVDAALNEAKESA